MRSMTLPEFAKYSASVPPDKKEEFDAMLTFVEGVVREECARLAENAAIPGHQVQAPSCHEIARRIRAGHTS
jgi:hypothetical protein